MEIVQMSKKELKTWEIISKTLSKSLSLQKAGEELGICLRQVKRLRKRVKEKGVEGLRHGNRGRPSQKKISSTTRARVLELIKRDYIDFGPELIKEQLEKRNQIQLSREWIRCLMIEEGLWKVKQRKKIHTHQRRKRREREGELIQIDGSPEYWFENRGPKCCLINMIDDATGKIMECRFMEEECLEGYFLSMKRYVRRHGRPLALYSDRHTIFKSPKSEEKQALTQFGRAMKELGIELIYANSPQAKGRVERSHGTLQDRLIKIMRLEGISSIEEGNLFLEKFREEYNMKFGKLAQKAENAHRDLPNEKNIDEILCRKEERKVSKSLEVQHKHTTYQIKTKKNVRRLIGATVMILELETGVVIDFQGEKLNYTTYAEHPYQERVLDRKRVDAFLDKKRPLSIIERQRKGMAINF